MSASRSSTGSSSSSTATTTSSRTTQEPEAATGPMHETPAPAHAERVSAVRDAFGPFLLTGGPTAPAPAWYDAHLFTIARLEPALGAAEAKTLIAFWARLKAAVKCVRPATPTTAADDEQYAMLTSHHLTNARRESDPGLVLRRLERVFDVRMFQGTAEAPSLAQYDAGLFDRTRLVAALGVHDARVVRHLWRRFRRALLVIHPELAA